VPELPTAVAALERGMADGLHVGAQLHVSRHGQTVASVAVGEAAPGRPMTTGTLMPWFSCTKLVTAIAVAQQWERGELDVDDPVKAHIPAFTGDGRDAVTVRHLLTHTSPLRPADGPPTLMRTELWNDAIARIVATPLERDWRPGRRAGYHLRGSFFLLGEIVRLLDGRPFDAYVRQEIFEPLGMVDSWLALTTEQFRRYGPRVGVMHDTTGPVAEPIEAFQRDDAFQRCVPAASGVGPVTELVRIAEVLLGKARRGDAVVLGPQAAEAMVARHRVDMVDETFGAKIDWGLGVMVNSWHYARRPAPYGYGDHASARAFGHGGVQSSLCFADPDPERGLAVALVCNGMPGEAANQRRTQPVISAVYEDLGIID